MSTGAPFILSLIGGIIQTIAGFVLTLVIGITAVVSGRGLWLLVFGLWFLVLGILSIIAGVKTRSEDSAQVRKWSVLMIIFSVLSGGNLLTLIGGIIGVVQSKEL